MRRRTLWTLGLVAICGPSGAAGWATAHEMVQAQYLLVGHYMAAHFERAAAMAEAVQVRPPEPPTPDRRSPALRAPALGYRQGKPQP